MTTLADHYWIVAGDASRVWSSARAAYVAPDDGSYVAWMAADEDRFPTRISSEADLDAVLRGIGLMGPLGPNADDVRGEALRRMMLAVGARDERHLEIIQIKGHETAIALLDKKADGVQLTPEEDATVQGFRAVRMLFEAIRAASNVLEPSPPADFADDRHWPAMGGA